MNHKQALIVDDSKTAQYLLKRMLQQYELSIDIASSAEEALAYLSYNHPSVIFLDQQMTGMTGFEALRTIKANPHTALIPVIMYSSQNDDVFVSQAIALGAQGVLSKGAMHPANLQQVLARLSIHLRSTASETEPAEPVVNEHGHIESNQESLAAKLVADAVEATVTATAEASSMPASPVATQRSHTEAASEQTKIATAELGKLQAQIGRLFELHITDLKTHLNNSTQFILKRVATSLERTPPREVATSASALAGIKANISSAIAAERKRGAQSNRLLLVISICLVLALGFLLLQLQSDTEQASQKILAALEQQHIDRSTLTNVAIAAQAKVLSPAAAQSISPALLQAVSWAQQADFNFEYNEAPLSGLRLSNLQQLVQLLADGGYRGPLIVGINFGNFCLEQDDTNTLRLARGDIKVSACKMQKDVMPQFRSNDYVSLQYQSFEKSHPALQDGRITLQLVSNGITSPSVAYPQATPQMTAGEWNRYALRNNRISIQIPG